jgi:hypothetical protein
MGKKRCFFDSKKTRYFDIEDVNLDQTLKMGTCFLKSKYRKYIMIWNWNNYPAELPNMPGAPYPVLFNYTISEECNKKSKVLESMSGRFVFELNSGTLPNLSPIGLPYGEYKGLTRNNLYDDNYRVCFSLQEDCMEVAIRAIC